MMPYLVCAVIMMTSFVNANELDPQTLKELQSAVYGKIMAHLDAEYQLLQPTIADQNRNMENCTTKITAAQEVCRTCASSRCQGDFGDWIVEISGFVGGWFGDNIVNWNGFNDTSNFFTGAFGRRRRDVRNVAMTARRLQIIRHRYMAKRMEELDPETRNCMKQCVDCRPFLADQTALIGGVCGDTILLDQAAMAKVISNMTALFIANGNPLQGKTPIIVKIEFDQTDFEWSDFSVGSVYVTANTPDGVVRYPSNHRYKMQSPEATVENIAQELIDKWNI